MQIREMRTADDVAALATMGRIHRDECASHLSFSHDIVMQNGNRVASDLERYYVNIWIAWNGDVPIGYAVGNNSPFFYSTDTAASLNLLYVLPAYRKGWAAVRLVKAFEEWARLNGAVRMTVGVERTDKDEAKRIRAVFPKMGYDWAGSYYLKELTQ